MFPFIQLSKLLDDGALDETLAKLACTPAGVTPDHSRVRKVLDGFQSTFHPADDAPAALFSAPGRTELGGNHTDHQHGRVLAAPVNLDLLSCAAPNGKRVIRICSEGWPVLEVDLDRLEPVAEEINSTGALVRGIAARIGQLGYPPVGFDAYVISDVLPGSGLSSSAAYETLIGVILNHFSCGDALDAVAIAQIGQYAENVFFGKPCGLMDQMASSVGGAVAIDFADPAKPVVRQIPVDLESKGYALCIIDSGADHADLTDEYAAIPAEMKAVASFCGGDVLRNVPEETFWQMLPSARVATGDRAILRAIHYYNDDRCAVQEADALAAGDFDTFLKLATASGVSSWTMLQNVCPAGATKEQAVSVALAVAQAALKGRGGCRVHGGGFAGTIQAFVPVDLLDSFKAETERVLGQGRCHVLSIRSVGGCVVAG